MSINYEDWDDSMDYNYEKQFKAGALDNEIHMRDMDDEAEKRLNTELYMIDEVDDDNLENYFNEVDT